MAVVMEMDHRIKGTSSPEDARLLPERARAWK